MSKQNMTPNEKAETDRIVTKKNVQALTLSNKELQKMLFEMKAHQQKNDAIISNLTQTISQTHQEIAALRGMALIQGLGKGPTEQ